MDGSKSNGLQINDSSYYYEIKHHNGFNIKGQKQHFQVIKLSKSRLHRLNQIKEQALVNHGVNDPLAQITVAKKHLKFHLNAKKYYIRAVGHDMSTPILKSMINKILSFLS